MDEGPGSAAGPSPPRGRIRPGENEPPPLWFGVAFALVGVSIIGLGLGFANGVGLGLLVLGVGLLFASIGVGMTLTTLRAARARVPVTVGSQRDRVDVFTRSPMRILVDLVLAPIGGLGFLVLAVVCLALGPIAWIGSLVFGFFGVLVVQGSAVTMRRGARRAVAEVGPDGIWTPELPYRLAWDEIERVEVEDAIGSAGDRGAAVYRRLGIWPRDPSLAERSPGRSAVGLVRAFSRFVNSFGSSPGLSDPSRIAPFGIQAYEIEQDFAELLRSVGRHVDVAGVRRGEEETAPRRLVPPAAPLDGVLGAIAANLARQAGFAPSGPGSLVDVGSRPTAAAPAAASPPESSGARETLSFRRRPGGLSITRLLADAWGPLFMAAFPVFWIGIQLAIVRMPLGNWLLILPFDLVAVAFFGYGVSGLLELPARWRASRGDPVLAVVEPEGLRMVGMGHLTWGRIAAVRVAASDIATNEGSPPIRRLEVVPTDPGRLEDRPWSDRAYDRLHGLTRQLNPVRRRAARAPGAFGLDLDLLEDPEGLLDAIARYCLVDERG